MAEAISQEKLFDIYFVAGDKQSDLLAVNAAVRKLLGLTMNLPLSRVKLRQVLFLCKPSSYSFVYEWEKMHELFREILFDEASEVYRHFVVTDNIVPLKTSRSPNLFASSGTPPKLSVIQEI